jgi:HK97 gp10 family phage protein
VHGEFELAKVSFQLQGFDTLLQNFDEIAQEIGDKKANSKILVPAMREAMKPTLAQARQLAPKDTGALAAHLQVEARRPTKRDRRSKYILPNDNVVALVTTKAFPKKLKKKFYEENKNLSTTERAAKFKQFALSTGFPYDARAIAQEFGSARNPAHPYMRTALESASPAVLDKLGTAIAYRIDNYKAR